ncbi:MAG: hypothetical protein Q9195_003737 [Heterodermia aff. obscurata]
MSSSTPSLLSFLRSSYHDIVPSSTTEADVPTLSTTLFPSNKYTEPEKIELSQWLTTSSHLVDQSEDVAKHTERLGSLDTHLATRTTLLGSKPSVADVALYHSLAPLVREWGPDERTGEKGYPHIVRWLDFVQNSPVFGLKFNTEGFEEKVKIELDDVRFVRKPIDAKEEKERKKKEKAEVLAAAPTLNGTSTSRKDLPVRQGKPDTPQTSTAAAATDNPSKPTKKEKKEKAPKPAKAAPKETPLTPSLIDLRVGHILHCTLHPNADSLFVSTIACGDPPGTDNTSTHEPSGQIVRTVCSGLNGLVPIAEMQNRKIIAVCNLKPVTMRGVKSAAMVLAASPRVKDGEDPHKAAVELVSPPEGAEAGERVYFDGWEGEPEGVLNPKKKVWEMCQVGFTTTESREVAFDGDAVEQLREEGRGKGVRKLVTTGRGVCTVKSLKGASVS